MSIIGVHTSTLGNSEETQMGGGVHCAEYIQLYVSAQKRYPFELCHIVYTYAIQIRTRSHGHVHVWRTFKTWVQAR